MCAEGGWLVGWLGDADCVTRTQAGPDQVCLSEDSADFSDQKRERNTIRLSSAATSDSPTVAYSVCATPLQEKHEPEANVCMNE